MKNLLVATLFFCSSLFISGAPSKQKNFLEAVVSEDIEALKSLNDIEEARCGDLLFIDSIKKAAEKGSLESLKILTNHKCIWGVNVGIHDQLTDLAMANCHLDVFRWLYAKSGLGFNPSNVMLHIENAMIKKDYETVKFLLSLRFTSSLMILEAITKANDQFIRTWIRVYGWILQNAKDDFIHEVPDNLLHDNLIELILSPDYTNFSKNTITHLIKVLWKRYRGQTVKKLEEIRAKILQKKYYNVAEFLKLLIDVQNRPVYSILSGKEVIEFESKNLVGPFIDNIFATKNQI